jgi:hypothetical protein
VGRQDGARADVGHGRQVLLHLLAQRDHDRTGAAADRDVEGVGHQLGDAGSLVDLRDPLRDGREEAAVVHFLEALAVGLAHRDLADQQHQRRAVRCATCTPMAAWQAPGPRVTTRHAGPAGQLALRLGHVDGAGLEAAGDQLELVAHGVEAVEQVEVALARARRRRG